MNSRGKLWDKAFKIFSREARLVDDRQDPPIYFIRWQGHFMSAHDTSELMETFYNYYIYHQ